MGEETSEMPVNLTVLFRTNASGLGHSRLECDIVMNAREFVTDASESLAGGVLFLVTVYP